MSITNNCEEVNITPYCSFLDIESSFSPSFFSNMKGTREAHFNNDNIPDNEGFLPEINIQNPEMHDFPMFNGNFSHDMYIFL